MNIIIRMALSIVLTASMLLWPLAKVEAKALDDKKNELGKIQQEIKNFQSGLQSKQDQVRTLSDQVAVMDYQIGAIQQQIDILQTQINETNLEIENLNKQIEAVQAKLSKQQEILRAYVVEIYSIRNTSTLEMIASSKDFSEYMNQTEYVEKLQDKINDGVKEIKIFENQLNQKRGRLDGQKSQLSAFKEDQNQKKSALGFQRGEKEKILIQTQGEEAKFLEMISQAKQKEAQAQQEIQKMVQKLNQKGSGYFPLGGNVGHSGRGLLVGYQGNTGYSTGTHLHFTVFKNGVEVDPLPLLQSGFFSWPLNNPIITQYYGKPNWNAAYSFHNGIDLSAGYGAPIYMAAPGIVITDAWMPNGYGHYKIVDHGGGYMTLYGHMI